VYKLIRLLVYLLVNLTLQTNRALLHDAAPLR